MNTRTGFFLKKENSAVLHTSGLQSVAKMTLRFPVYNIDAKRIS